VTAWLAQHLAIFMFLALGIALYAREVVSRIMPEEDGK